VLGKQRFINFWGGGEATGKFSNSGQIFV